jgi:flagellin-specific chaperone FliS
MEALEEVKKALITFNYAEKIKTNLIMASSLLEVMGELKEAEAAGAERLLAAYFNALILEVNIAANASKIEGFRDIAQKLQEAVENLKKHNYAGIQRLVSEAISTATTHGSWAAQLLKEKSLI